MPIINTRLLLRLGVCLLVVAVGLHLLHASQAARIPEAILKQAERAAEQGKIDRAIGYTQQYLVFRPNDHGAMIRLGEWIETRGKSQKEFTTLTSIYEKVLRENPGQIEIRKKLIDLSLKLNRPVDAALHARAILEKDPSDAITWEQLGRAEIGVNKFNEARVAFEKAIQADRKYRRAYELLAYVQTKHLNQSKEAEKTLDEMVSRNPTDPEVYLVRARFRRSQNQLDSSLEDIARLQELAANSSEALLLRAEVMQVKGDIQKARTILSEGAREFPKEMRFSRNLAWLEVNIGNVNAAVTALEEGLAKNPGEQELLTPLVDLLIQRNDIARVEAMLDKLKKQKTPAAQLNYLRGRLAMQQGRFSEALGLLEPIKTEAVGSPLFAAQLNLLTALCHEQLGDSDRQLESIQRVLAIDPAHLSARVMLGNWFLNRGKLDEAIREYAIATKSPYAMYQTTSTLLKLQLSQASLGKLKPEATQLLGEALSHLRERFRSTPEPTILLAEWSLLQGKSANAIRLLKEESSRRMNDPVIWSALAWMVARVEGVGQAQELLQEAIPMMGETVEYRLTMARLRALESPERFAEQCRLLQESTRNLPGLERRQIAQGLSEIAVSIGETELQRSLLVSVLREANHSGPMFEQLLLRFSESNFPEREELIAKYESLAETLPGRKTITAALRTSSADASVRNDLSQLVREHPHRADLRFLFGKQLEKANDLPAAQKQYQAACEFDRTSTLYLETWLASLVKSGDRSRVEGELNRLVCDPRVGSVMLSTVLGTLFQQTGSENAEALAKIVPLPVRRDSLTLLTVTHRLAKQNRPEVARPIASLGQGSVGENPDLWSASLAQSLKGKNPLAINSLLAQAKKNLPPISFSRAVAPLRSNLLSLNGLTDWQGEKAERAQLQQQEYRFVLRQGDLERANRLLDLASKDSELGVENRSWVERERLQLLARIGEEANRLELTPLTVIASTEEKRHRVTLLATLLQSASGARRTELLRDGIALLESITRDSSATDRDWFRLGQFYRLTNDRPGYRKTLDELTRREPENLFYLAAKVDELLVDGNLTEAQSEMPKLRKGVHDFRVLSTVCRFACLNQQPEEVHAAVDRYLAAAEVGTGDDQLRIRRTAELYDQLQRIAMGRGYASASAYLTAAMEKYRLAVRNDLESLPPFVEMLARTQQVPAAMELLQSLKPRLNGRVLMTSGMTVLRTGHATPRQYQQVRDWIDEQEKQPSQAKLATMHRADWFALQGKFPEAEAVYRKVLEADASNVVALNNLAWILAASPNRADEALKFIDTAIEKLGPSGELLDTKARILISKGSYAMAEQNLQEALGESKTSLRYFHLALSKLKQSRKDEALQAFREARSRGLEVKQIHPDDLTTFKVLTSQTDR